MMKKQTRIGQKYQVNDQVFKKIISSSQSMPRRKGKILSVEKRTNSRGYPTYYYQVQWSDLKSPSIHAQHVLLKPD